MSTGDEAALLAVLSDLQSVPARTDLVREGEKPTRVHVVVSGLVCRYKLLPDGGRQIMAWLVPGDFCDLHVAVLERMDHGLATLAPSKIAFLPLDEVHKLATRSAALARAFWWATLVDEAVLREWLVNMGRRPADQKIAHLFCELHARMNAVGLAPGGVMDLPLTQMDLADTLGLSTVHVNRVLQQLRDDNLIVLEARRLRVIDPVRLAAFAGFDDNYLHMNDVVAPA